MIKWGHFSDLHFKFVDDERLDTNLLRLKLLDTLIDDGINLDYIFITGDIFHKGTYEEATTKFIKNIAEATNCDLENIIICAGNHDAERSRNRKRDIEGIIQDYEKKKKLDINEKDEKRLFDEPFTEFWKNYEKINNFKKPNTPHYYIPLKGINLYVLNTAVFAGQTCPEDKPSKEELLKENTNLFISDKHFQNLIYQGKTDGYDKNNLNIVIGHHGIECFHENEQLELKKVLHSIETDAYLCGHVHKDAIDVIKDPLDYRQISCGGLFSDDYNSPTFVLATFKDNEIELVNYTFLDKGHWEINNSAPVPYNSKGKYKYPIKRLGEQKKHLPVTVYPQMTMESNLQSMHEYLTVSKSPKRKYNNTPFKNSFETLQKQFNNLTTKHILLLDKYYLAFLDKLPSLSNIGDFLINEKTSNEQQAYIDFNTLLNSVIYDNTDELILDSPNGGVRSIIAKAIEHYDILFQYLVSEYLENDNNLRIKFGNTKKSIIDESKVFWGYEKEIKELKNAMKNGGYVYIYGEQYYGKTSLIAKVMNDLIFEKGVDIEGQRIMTPYLPEYIVIFGKHVFKPENAILMLVEAINMILPTSYDVNEIREDRSYIAALLEDFCTAFEHHIVIIIDAIDEIDVNLMSLFPAILPKNCTVVFSNKLQFDNKKYKLNDLKIIEMKGLTKQDIYNKLNIKTPDDKQTKFVNYIMKQTKGNPILIKKIFEGSIIDVENLPEINTINISLKKHHEDEKLKWITGEKCVCEILELLAIFESVAYLKIEDFQAYLNSKGTQLKTREISRLLKDVLPQLSTDTEDKYKLKYNAFAVYLTDNMNTLDLKITFEDIINWLISDNSYSVLLVKFFINMFFEYKIVEETSNNFIDLLISKNKIDELTEITTSLCFFYSKFSRMRKKIYGNIQKCFSVLDINSEELIGPYFNFMYVNAENKEIKIATLEKVIEQVEFGNKEAIYIYAKLLYIGDEIVSKDINTSLKLALRLEDTEKKLILLYCIYKDLNLDEEAKICLNKLIGYDNDEAHRIYAVCLAEDRLYEQDVIKSEEILNTLVEKDYKPAIATKARLIARHIYPNYDISIAYKLWTQAGKYSAEEMYLAGSELYFMGTLANDKEVGLELLQKAVEKNYEPAIYKLAYIKLSNNQKCSKKEYEIFFNLYENYKANINMAFMLRKGFVKNKEHDVEKLLLDDFNASNPLAIFNLVLYKISKYQSEADWETYIEDINRIDVTHKDFEQLVSFWRTLAQGKDTEGDLVIALLLYTKKITQDPDGTSLAERVERAKSTGINIPNNIICVS